MRAMVWMIAILALSACGESGETNAGAGKAAPASSASVNTGIKDLVSTECLSAEALRPFGQVFADKKEWEMLPRLRDWRAVRNAQTQIRKDRMAVGGGGIDAFVLRGDDVIGSLGWHEGVAVCIQQREGEYWARMPQSEPSKQPPWEGPFIPVPGASGKPADAAYFNRIFGQVCHETAENEPWCFGDGSLQIGDKHYRAELVLDGSEMPSYGSPVRLAGQKEGFLVFVPAGDGWNVYKDDYVSKDDHVEIDPKRDPPWRKLRPQPAR